MGNLILDSLEIRGFRGFRHLQIERLGRVNLIVGKNNVGKSSLLEGLWLYAQRGEPELIWQLLKGRDEYIDVDSASGSKIDKMLMSLKYLFYGREEITTYSKPVQIGSVETSDDTMILGVGWYVFQKDGDVRRRIRLKQLEEYNGVDDIEIRFNVQLGTEYDVNYQLPLHDISRHLRLSKDPPKIKNVFIGSDGLNIKQLDKLWANVALTSLEKEILLALRIVAPGVEDLNILGDVVSARTIFVKVASINERIPLRSLGNGMLRTLGVVLALVNAKDGFLLIDEIENGLHYSVQPDLWRLIFRLAHSLNVQVFAATHSWDCIRAFQEVASEDSQEGILLRLQSKKDDISAVEYNEEELKIATQEQIEVR